MFDYLILALCVYVVYNNIQALMEVPAGEWELVHWLLVLITVALAVLGVVRARMIYVKWKKGKEEAAAGEAEGAEDAAADAAADEAAGIEGPVEVTMADLEKLDEIDLDDDEEDSVDTIE